MSFFSALYSLLIGPLELFFEVLFSMVNRVVNQPGLSIIFLSLAMNFLVLPLYKMSDAMQAEEAATEAKLKPTVSHIKKTFKGDERFMVLQMYYKENHYKPSDALKGSVSLLLEIPFFMAAYNFLSGLPILHGASLGPISNLAVPDAMLVLGDITINVLPILMTAINLISSAIYTKGSSTRSKVQLYVMAGLFLVLLYDSPSGLVFYWTLNNLFSLGKNVFMKLRNPKKVFCWMCTVVGTAALIFVAVTHPMPTARSQFLLCCLTLMLQLPLLIYFIAKHIRHTSRTILTKKDSKTFWIAGLFLTVLTGMFIPSGVISASPEEFMNAVTHASPLNYILNATLTAAGFFLIWFGMFYLLAKINGKKWMNYGMCALSFIAVVDFMFFGKNYGNMSANLVFDVAPVYAHRLLNLLVVAVVSGLVYLIWKKKQEVLRFVVMTATLASVVISVVNIVNIYKVTSSKYEQLQEVSDDLPVIPLSKNGKNVIVLMLDRAINSYVPYMMNEKPELKEQFDGFTYYPNTISYGAFTNFGSPALFGGYEYTPEEMNNRSSESLESKQNEALSVLPVIFDQAAFETTVCDPPYAGYDWIPDLSIYDAYPHIHAYNTMGKFALKNDPFPDGENLNIRNFFCYSIFKISPTYAQPYLYADGNYNSTDQVYHQAISSVTNANGLNGRFCRAYAVLDKLPNITYVSDSDRNTFLMLTNDTAHEPCLLSEPEYIPNMIVDNAAYSTAHMDRFELDGKILKMDNIQQITHYQVNMAAFLKLGDWFDFLRLEGVYDNTRIIIVSDHGRNLNQFDHIQFSAEEGDDIMLYNPLLMVKDFDCSGFKTDTSFMTNADTPILATNDVISNPINPFTGNPIDNSPKYSGAQHIFFSHIWETSKNNGNTFLPGPWYSVHDDIFNIDNWEYLGIY